MPAITSCLRNAFVFLVSMVLSVSLAFSATAHAGESGLDPTFGSAGLAVSDFGASAAGAVAVALAPDGTIVAAGPNCTLPPTVPSGCGLALVRYSPGGAELQRTPTGFSAAPDLLPTAVAVDSLGRIVVVGHYYSRGWSSALVRYLSDGSIDPTLSMATLPSSFGVKEISAVAIDSTDRVLLAGPSFPESADSGRIRVARMTPGGSPDPAFGGGDGVATLDPEPLDGPQGVSDLVIAPTGAIFIGGVIEIGDPEAGPSGMPLISALDATGAQLPGFSAPASFGKNSRSVTGIALDSSGRLLASLFGKLSMSVVRLDSDGSLDPSFGANGLASISLCSHCDNEAAEVAVDAADRPYAIGYGTRLTRYTATGAPDLSFAPGGTTTIRFGNRYKGSSADLLIGPSGDALVAGSRTANLGVRESLRAPRQFALARYGYPTCHGHGATPSSVRRTPIDCGGRCNVMSFSPEAETTQFFPSRATILSAPVQVMTASGQAPELTGATARRVTTPSSDRQATICSSVATAVIAYLAVQAKTASTEARELTARRMSPHPDASSQWQATLDAEDAARRLVAPFGRTTSA